MNKKPEAIQILLDSARGQYIPQHFAEEMDLSKFEGIDSDDIDVLREGPEHEWYWEAWDMVLQNAFATDGDYTFMLYQDGDLFAVCNELLTDEEYQNFYGESRD